jgi:hypothetical protein
MQIPAARVKDPSIYRLVFCMYLGHVSSGGGGQGHKGKGALGEHDNK